VSVGWRAPTALFAAVVLGALLLTTTSTAPPQSDKAPMAKADVDRRLEGGTASLIGLGCDLSLDQGTAIAIAPSQVLTNRHVVERLRSLDVVYGATAPIIPTRQQIGVSTANDVAVVGGLRLGTEPVPLAAEDPWPGEEVWVAGFAHDSGGDTLADGLTVKAARVVDYVPGQAMGQRSRVLRLDVPVRPGMSGGPVLDQTGRLAGVVFAVQSPTDDALAIPVSVVRAMLRSKLTQPRGC
jgi:S1-C subfamily serine protease